MMADTVLPRSSSSTMPVTGNSPASGDRWTSLRSVRVTPPGTSPRVLLRPLPADPGFKVTEEELRRREASAERVRDTVPRLLMEFADRLEAVFSRGTVLRFDFSTVRGKELQTVGKAAADHASVNRDSTDESDGKKLGVMWSASREASNASPTTEAGSATEHRPSETTKALSPVQKTHNRDDSDAGESQRDVLSATGELTVTERTHVATTAVLCEKGVCLGTPDHDTPPAKRRTVQKKQLLWADSADTRVNACPPRDQQTFLPPGQENKRLYGGDVDSESLVSHSPSHTFSVFVTPRRGQPDPEFKRPSRPCAQLKRSPVAGRWQRSVASLTRSRRSEEQLLVKGSSWQCDAAETPHRRRTELKPEKVSNRWQHMSAGKDGRPRPDLKPSPVVDRRRRSDSPLDTTRRDHSNANHPTADKTPPCVSVASHRFRSELQLPAVSDRCQDDETTRPRRDRPEFKLPPPCRWTSSATPRGPTTSQTVLNAAPPAYGGTWETPTGLPAVPRALPALSPGGSGDKLRRVYRWLESSLSVTDPTEKTNRPRQRTPSLAGSSIVSGRQRRRRLDYTEEEVHNLLRGVEKYGRDFQAIRMAYEFHPSRTTVDLYDKWRHMPGTPGRQTAGAGDARPQAVRR